MSLSKLSSGRLAISKNKRRLVKETLDALQATETAAGKMVSRDNTDRFPTRSNTQLIEVKFSSCETSAIKFPEEGKLF